MLPIYVQPDILKLVIGFLRAQPEVTALVPASQIRGQLGDDPTFPAVRVTRIASETVVSDPPVLDLVAVQLDVWGGNNRQAERIAATCKSAAVWRMQGYSNDEGVVTKVVASGPANLPDETFKPPRERYIVELAIMTRPNYD